jgi:hypothetical protein
MVVFPPTTGKATIPLSYPQGSFDHFQASQLRSKRQRPLNSSPRG